MRYVTEYLDYSRCNVPMFYYPHVILIALLCYNLMFIRSLVSTSGDYQENTSECPDISHQLGLSA